MVGVNIFPGGTDAPPEILQIDESVAGHQVERLRAVRARRDSRRHAEALERLREAAAGDANTMPFILEAVKAYASVGEIVEVLKSVFGIYHEPIFL